VLDAYCAPVETIREAPKLLLINLIQDSDHGLLNNLVLQCRDAQSPFPTIRFRNVHRATDK